ncbi:ATP/maltotriose-dependent transcriptional regulator MalT, partial [Paraburkholderia sp. GAS32]
PSAWLINPRCMPYCFRCLVLNDADVSAPRWKREWLEPTAEFCSVHHTLLETVPASVFRLSGHFAAALRAISRYREMRKFKDYRRLR